MCLIREDQSKVEIADSNEGCQRIIDYNKVSSFLLFGTIQPSQ